MPYVPANEAALSAERARLVRLCYRLTGSLDVAEDLAQETLYEAVRNAHKLHDRSGYARWLSSIARNVCLRWNSTRGRAAQPVVTPDQDWDVPADDYDLDVELERHELVELLDRALALLPPQSREVLVERYVRKSPHAEIAARLGLTEAGVAKRLERGRLRRPRTCWGAGAGCATSARTTSSGPRNSVPCPARSAACFRERRTPPRSCLSPP